MCLLVSAILLTYAVICGGGKTGSHRILDNKAARFFSGISMEIYLSHMVMFRLIEKLGIHQMFGNGWIQYCITVCLVLVGTVLFAVVMRRIINISENKFSVQTTRKG